MAREFSRVWTLIVLCLLLSGLTLPASAQAVAPPSSSGSPALPDLLPLAGRPDPVLFAPPHAPGSTPGAGGPLFTLLTQFDGETEAAAVRGNIAYVATGPRLYIVDVSDPAHTSVLGMTEPFPDMVVDVAVQGNYAYLANWTTGVQVIDVADPAHPRKVATWKAAQPGAAFALAVSGSYAYVANGAAGFRVVNVADPLNPIEAGALATSGQPHGVAIAGELAYVADYDAGLKIVNIADPAHPTLAGSLDTPGNALKVHVAGSRAYVADQAGGVRIVDISNPAAPVEIGVASNGSTKSILDATVIDHYLFGAQSLSGRNSDNRLVAWDVADPAHPVSLESPNNFYAAAPSPLRVTQSAGKLYVSRGQLGLTIYEPTLGTATDPLRLLGGRTWLYGYTMDAADGRLYASSGNQDLYIYGVDQPSAPVNLRGGSVDLGKNGVPHYGLSFIKIAAASPYAYVGALIDRIITLNVSDPANVKQSAWYDSGSSTAQGITYDIALQGGYAYVAYDIGGLLVMDLANPAIPRKKALLATPGDAVGIAVLGNYAYVADYAAGVQVVDISDPAHPAIVGTYPTNPYWTAGIAAWDHYVAVTANVSLLGAAVHKLIVLDVANPQQPVKVGESPLGADYAVDLALEGKYAHLAATYSGVRAFDLSSPADPELIATYNTAGYTLEVDALDGAVYAADTRGGIVVLELAGSPAQPGGRIYLPMVVRAGSPMPEPTPTPTATAAPAVTPTPTPTATPTATQPPAQPGITGRVTFKGQPAEGFYLILRFYNGSTWSTAGAPVRTSADGAYRFTAAAPLGQGQKYRVAYRNGNDGNVNTSAYLAWWQAGEVTSYDGVSSVAGGDFDVANIELTSPNGGATLPLPTTFRWQMRDASPDDTYEFNLLYYPDYSPWGYINVGHADSFTLTGLPSGFSYGVEYVWDVWTYGGGGYGESYWGRYITFRSGNQPAGAGQSVQVRNLYRGK